MLDPELLAVLAAVVTAALLGLPGLRTRRRDLKSFCGTCGRRVLHGVKTCECDF